MKKLMTAKQEILAELKKEIIKNDKIYMALLQPTYVSDYRCCEQSAAAGRLAALHKLQQFVFKVEDIGELVNIEEA